MSELTAEQVEAQDQLQAAIETHVRVFRSGIDTESMEIAGDWVVVVGVVSLDLESQERRYTYHLGFSGGEQPEHIAHGLLAMGGKLIDSGVREE